MTRHALTPPALPPHLALTLPARSIPRSQAAPHPKAEGPTPFWSQQQALPCLPPCQVISKLHHILKPFLLRRVKTDVETSLPGKLEVVLYASMSDKQRTINQQLRDKTLGVRSCAWWLGRTLAQRSIARGGRAGAGRHGRHGVRAAAGPGRSCAGQPPPACAVHSTVLCCTLHV